MHPATPLSQSYPLAHLIRSAIARLCLGAAICISMLSLADHFKVHTNVPFSAFPEQLRLNAKHHPLDVGYLDVTKPPYDCDATGRRDATQGLRNAIADAYGANLAVHLPSGTYLCSGEIECIQTSIPGAGWSQRKFGHILIGSAVGPRPILKLADGSALKNDIFVQFEWRGRKRGKPATDVACHYIATFRGIDIDMGSNPGKTALVNRGHQQCVIEDAHIYGKTFRAGVSSPPGCGGSIGNVQVTGGDIGIEMLGYRPTPLFTGITLVGQRNSAVVVRANTSPVTMVGFQIRGGEAAEYCAVDLRNSHGGMNLVDGRIEVANAEASAVRNEGEGALYAANVFVKAASVLDYTLDEKERKCVTGSAAEWRVFDIASKSGCRPGYVNLAGVEHGSGHDGVFRHTVAKGVPPPDLMTRHAWPPTPAWESAVSITVYGATQDDPEDDDAPAIQRAIDQNIGKVVLIPRGHFHIGQAVTVRPGTTLVGAAKNISVIHALDSWRPETPCFLLDTVDADNAGIYLDNFALDNRRHGDALDGNRGHLRVRSANTIIRDIQVVRQGGDGRFDVPSVLIQGSGGGRIYSFSNDDGVAKDVSGSYHKLAVRNTTNPLGIYAASIEHQVTGSAQIGMYGARNVNIYALKFESAAIPLLALRDCTGVRLIGMYGNFGAAGESPLIDIRESTALTFANLTRNKAKKQYVAEKPWICGDVTLAGAGPVVVFTRPSYGGTARPR